MEKSRFFQEIQRLGTPHGFEVSGITNDGKLELSHDNKYLCRIQENGTIFYRESARELLEGFHKKAKEARYYVTAVAENPPLIAEGLGEGYVLLCDHGDTVLAGKDMGKHGYQFITWDWTYEKTGLMHGRYYQNNYIAAKEDFAFRSGLVRDCHQYSVEQAHAMHGAISLVLDRHLCQTTDEWNHLRECQEKLETMYPELDERITVLVAERHKPTEARYIRKHWYAIEDIVEGPVDASEIIGQLQYCFNGYLQHDGYAEEKISRILPDGAVIGPLVVVARNPSTGKLQSLTEENIAEIKRELDMPERRPNATVLVCKPNEAPVTAMITPTGENLQWILGGEYDAVGEGHVKLFFRTGLDAEECAGQENIRETPDGVIAAAGDIIVAVQYPGCEGIFSLADTERFEYRQSMDKPLSLTPKEINQLLEQFQVISQPEEAEPTMEIGT